MMITMSGASGSSRGNSRSSKDKTGKTNSNQNTKTDGPPSKIQATPEQMRLAQIFPDKSGADEELQQKLDELRELTGKDYDDIAVALHDCENDLNRTYLMLMEGENDQGEWKEPGKKKKRQPAAAQKGNDSSSYNHSGESKPERAENHQRGRGERDGERDRDKDGSDYTRNESSSRRGRRDTRPPRLSRGRGRDRDRGGDMMWRDNDQDNDKKTEEGSGGGRERGRGRGRGVNGPGKRGGRGGGGGRGGENTSRNFRSPRYEKGPQIDTWTNETAENAEKETQVMWGDSTGPEDWNDDSWTGSLTETKVFTSTSIQGGPVGPDPSDQPTAQGLPDTANTLPHNNSLPQRLDIGALLQKSPGNDVSVMNRVTESQFISQYNKEATESIKNSIGIGSASRPNMEPTQNSTVNQLASLGSSLTALQQSGRLPPTQSGIPNVSLQQRPKPQKSKLPPPSKIPASAVEMPGHMVTSLDVQFGNLEFGADSFSFGGSDGVGTNNYTVSAISSTSGAPGLTNHLDQVSSTEASLTAMRGGTTPNKSTGIPGLDQTSPRAAMFPSSSYSTTPTKKEINSPEPIPFPSSQSDLKTSPLVSSQRPGQAANSLQGSLSSNSADSSGLYGQPAGYQSSSYKSSGMNSSQNFTHSSGTLSQSAQYPNSLASQTSQNQYQTSQNQYQTTQNQYPSYQSGTAFQSQAGFSSSANQNSLYQSVTSAGSYQNQSYPSRDSQSGASFQTSVTQSSGSSYALDSQTSGSYQRDSQTTNSYQRESQPSVSSYQRDGQSSGSTYQSPQTGAFQRDSQSGSPYTRDTQSSSTYTRDTQPSNYQRDAQSSSVAYSRDGQTGSSFQREAQSASSSYQRDSQSGGYPRDSGSGSSYSRDNQSASSYHRDSQSAGSAYGRDSQSSSSTNYPRDSSHSGSGYGQQAYSSTNHQSLQTSPLTAGKLSDSLSKMTVKDSTVDNHQVSQHSYEHPSSSTTAGLTTTTSTASSSLANISTGGGSSMTATTTANISTSKTNVSSLSSTSKGPPNLPPGVPLLNAQYIMNMSQGGLPPYFSLQQQPLYPGYEELQLLQQRGVALGSYYDMSTFAAPTTMAGRDQTTIGNVPYTGADGKLNRVEAQSPVPTTQPQQSQSAHQQPYLNPTLHPGYGYYPYPSMLPGAGFQYPHTMFMPPVTNTAAHGGSAGTNQYQKAYGSHSYGGGKGYDDLSQPQDFSKGYGGVAPSQAKVSGSVSSVTSGSGSATDLAGYSKSHAQVNAFDKQGFHAGTPNSFSLPMTSGTQGGPMGAPTNPYHQYMPMIPPHQAHSMLHHPLQQDSSSSGRGTQPSSTQPKSGGNKPYANYWGAN